MKPSCQVSHIQKIVVNTSLLDEGTLRIGYKLIHIRGKAGGHHLGNNLGIGMYEAYRPKVGDVLGSILLWDKNNVCGIEPMKIVGAQIGEVVDDDQKVMLNDVPTRFVEGPRKAVRSRSFMAMSPMYGLF
jgi:hypothetical protein